MASLGSGSGLAAGAGGLTRVKNKAPAKIQITAEQLLREAWENKEQSGSAVVAPRHQIADAEELAEYQQTTRKRFEDRIVMSRQSTSLWLRYARWEEAQRDFVRARSVFERAIDTDYRVQVVWLAYAEMEMRHKFVNHARNVWDRAVTLLPRVPQIWLKYAFMEEMLANVELTRLVFARWMQWKPELSAYIAYIRFEMRHGYVDKARAVYELVVAAFPIADSYLKYAGFEEKQAVSVPKAREVYTRATSNLPATVLGAAFFIAFAHFEERCRETERARTIYQYALNQGLPAEDKANVLDALTVFEKQRGEQTGVEAVVLSKKRSQYEERLRNNPNEYDVWFDLIRLEQTAQGPASTTREHEGRVRQVFERAVRNVPQEESKQYWRRYIYIWISYAVWEELEAHSIENAREVFRKCLATIPRNHCKFSFTKLWILAAKLEVRRKDLAAARRLFGHGLGVLPSKDALYREYIALEMCLGEIDRARTLYRKWLERNPNASAAFVEFADMECAIGQYDRARGIYEIGVSASELDAPEVLWKAYLDFEISNGETDNVVRLYKRLLDSGGHVDVWLSYAKFMQTVGVLDARRVYTEATRELKDRVVEQGVQRGDTVRKDRAALADAWVTWERSLGPGDGSNAQNVARAEAELPKRTKRRRVVTDARGTHAGWEEYYEFTFPEEVQRKPQLKLLEAARKWKRQEQETEASTGDLDPIPSEANISSEV